MRDLRILSLLNFEFLPHLGLISCKLERSKQTVNAWHFIDKLAHKYDKLVNVGRSSIDYVKHDEWIVDC